MRSTHRSAVTLLAASLLALAPLTAGAQETEGAQPPHSATPVPPTSARAANGEFVAPLSQPTQPSYVPQSVALSGPKELTDWEEGDPIPQGYHRKTRTRTGLIVGGAITFGTLYLISAFTAAGSSDSTAPGQSNPDAALWVPGVGPFIQMMSTSSATGNLALAIDGAAQTAGLAMLIYGLTSPKTILIRDDLGDTRPMVLPMRMGQDGYGLGVIGRF
jgi:hypothetical protein